MPRQTGNKMSPLTYHQKCHEIAKMLLKLSWQHDMTSWKKRENEYNVQKKNKTYKQCTKKEKLKERVRGIKTARVVEKFLKIFNYQRIELTKNFFEIKLFNSSKNILDAHTNYVFFL